MDKICFHKLLFYAYHGCFLHEALQGQEFELDLELSCNLWAAGQSDQLADSIDYGQVYQLVKEIVTQRRFHLIEALGQCICQEIFAAFPAVMEIHLSLKKPRAPLEGGIIADEQLQAQDSSATSSTASPSWQSGHFSPGGGTIVQLERKREQF